MGGYSEYRPHGEVVQFQYEATDPRHAIALAVRACERMAPVVRPGGYDVWWACAFEDVLITVPEPEPSVTNQRIMRRGTPDPLFDTPKGPPPTVRRVPELDGGTLSAFLHGSLGTLTCPPGYRVMLDQLTPLRTRTRVVDGNEAARGDEFPVSLWGADVTYRTVTDPDGAVWLDQVLEHPPHHHSPVMFELSYDGLLYLHVIVHWIRWRTPGTGEYGLLQQVYASLRDDGWSEGPRHSSYV
ncbi:hypothetical protein ACSNOI_38695 [Actinomadura kijaniata]|uniref:hypothetical protein n=1 Tax=Actinomadura kijaniata TaxID=46161 RepID=UPI003F1CC0B7